MKDATLPVDPNVKIPAAVRATIELSEQMFNEFKDAPEGEEVTPEGNQPDPATDPASLADSQPQDQPQNQPVTGDDPAPAQPDDPQADPPDDDSSWKQKFQSEHGRVQKLRQTVSELTERLGNLERILSSVQAPPSADPAPSEAVDEEATLSPDELNDYGEDFLKVVGKKARQEVAPLLNAYKSEIASLRQTVAQLQGKSQLSEKEKLHKTLDEALPNWREINRYESFIDWLALPDAFSGAIRHNMLKEAYAQGDARRVLAFFNGFLAEEAAVAPARQEPDPRTETVQQIPLESLAAPGRAKTAAPAPAPAEKPFFTRAQIAAFYADVAAGKFRGRDAEKNTLEAQIFAAQREGRIR